MNARTILALATVTSLGTLAMLAGFAPRASAPAAALSALATGEAQGNVDPVHTYILFRIKHLNVGYSYGRFDEVSGNVSINDADLSKSSLTLDVKTTSINTGNAKRDGHLKSNDFFAAAENPTATFKSTSIKKAGEGAYDVTGDLSIRGKTKSVSFKLAKTGQGKSPQGGEIVGYETTLTINRLDFGVAYMPDLLGTDVQLTVALEAAAK
jgi:polyisoprenoid-binding protein YceI